MNRKLEYEELLQELDKPVPKLERTLERAYAKKKHRSRMIRPFVSVAATFVLFVVLVNFCSPVAYACSKVPILCDLAKAVTFSRSLSDAVENEYVQNLDLTRTDGDITVSVEYLIVDRKQVNVFFRLDSEVYSNLGVNVTVSPIASAGYYKFSYGLNDWNVPNGDLRSLTVDFEKENVPDKMLLKLKVYNLFPENTESEAVVKREESVDEAMFKKQDKEEPEYLAQFKFLLEFDPTYTETGKQFDINQTVELDGQKITLTEIEVYPSQLRVNVSDTDENTAWLTQLYFYIETENGMKFDMISNGISIMESTESPTKTSFCADSSYFYEAEQLKIVITGAEFLNKDMEKTYVNLKIGETGPLPEGVTFHSATKEKGGWLVSFEAKRRKENESHQVFMSKYYDAKGKEYQISTMSYISGDKNADGEITSFIVKMPLKGYFKDEVWMSPEYSYVWTAEEPVEIMVDLK